MNLKSPSTHKKVVVELANSNQLRGYINPRQFDRREGLELLDEQCQLRTLAWKQVRCVWFVRDWDETKPRPEPARFTRRPRLEGLWVRLRFRDNQVMEGILVNDLLHLSDHGYLLTPPDLTSGQQKVFVPKAALSEIGVLAVIPGHAARRRPAAAIRQPRLFVE